MTGHGRTGVARTLAFALGAGALTGLAEMAPLALAMERGSPLRLTRQIVWMTPVADAAWFVLLAGALLAAGRLWAPVGSPRAVLGTLAGAAALALLLLVEPLHDLASLLLAAGIGVQAARLARGRSVAPRLIRAGPLLAGACGLAVLALATWSLGRGDREEEARLAALPAAPAGAPNVLLVILDTVRARALGFYGHPGGGTPHLDSLARGGVVFERAVAPAPWTLPSHASLFTGRWPFELDADWLRPLGGDAPTLAETLSARGYATAGFVGNLLYASRETGLARGFARYEDYPVSPGQVVLASSVGRALAYDGAFRGLVGHHELLNRTRAGDVNRGFLDWVDSKGERPWFAFLNYYDAHEPLFPPDSLAGPGWNDYGHRGGIRVGGNAWREAKWRMSPEDVALLDEAYHTAVRGLDEEIGRLLEGLRARGALDNTVVVIASDHGEQLGEHGLFAHNNSLYMTAVHVALAIVWPGRVPAGATVAEPVSLRDLPATILDLVGAPASLPGVSLAPLWQPGGAVTPSPAISYLTRGYLDQPGTPLGDGLEMQSILVGPWHYIHNGDGSDVLFDLDADPHQRVNLTGSPGPDSVVVEIRAILYEKITGRPAPEGLPVRPPGTVEGPPVGRGPRPGLSP